MPAARGARRAPTKKTKKAATKKAATKKPATKAGRRATKAKKPNGANGAGPSPIEGKVKGEMKYKLKAIELEFEQVDQRVMQAIAPEINKLIARAKRNDPGWLKAAKERQDVINEFLDKEVGKLADGMAIININAKEGTYRAVHDPERRDQRFQM